MACTVVRAKACGLEDSKRAVSKSHFNKLDLALVDDVIADEGRVTVSCSLVGAGTSPDAQRPSRTIIGTHRIERGKLAEEWLPDDESRAS